MHGKQAHRGARISNKCIYMFIQTLFLIWPTLNSNILILWDGFLHVSEQLYSHHREEKDFFFGLHY